MIKCTQVEVKPTSTYENIQTLEVLLVLHKVRFITMSIYKAFNYSMKDYVTMS